MTQGYGKLIREGYEAWNLGDRSFVLEHLSPDVVWVTPPDDPDQGVFRGHDAVQKFWDQWQAAVGQLKFEIEELTETGNRVLAVVKRSGVGHHSGLAVSDVVCQVFFFEDKGTCSLVREFYDRSKATAAAGTPEREESVGGRDPAHT